MRRHSGPSKALPAALVTAGLLVGGGGAAAFMLWLLNDEPAGTQPVAIAHAAGGAIRADAPASERAPEQESVGRRKDLRAPVHPRRRLAALTSVYDWPKEPVAPIEVDESRFIEAMVLLCGPHADDEVRSWYAGWVLRYARELGADPFLLGAVVFRASGCRAAGGRHGVGLTGLFPEMYEQDVRSGAYHYRAYSEGKWLPRTIKLGRFPFDKAFLKAPESNLYFAAAFLRAWREQKQGLFVSHVQKEYRHHVSHFLWGDVVRSRRQETWILVDRRRLLEYYGAIPARPAVRWRGFELGCPLDGCPRVITSTLGDSRAGGRRTHRGVDFESTRGEPVRAIADGVVVFAGVDLPGKAANRRLPIYAQRSVERSVMGAGGLYVCIRHEHPREQPPLLSCYMHLDVATVVQRRKVKRGDQVGVVGSTGIKVSRPHLHFELHARDGIHAADEAMPQLVLGKPKPRPPKPGAIPSGLGPPASEGERAQASP